MFEKLNFLTVYLVIFVLTLACAAIVPPLVSQALETNQTKITLNSTSE